MNEPTIREIKHCYNCNSKHEGVCLLAQPTQGGVGGCIKCGSMQIYPWMTGGMFDDDDESCDLFRCSNCGLIASETT